MKKYYEIFPELKNEKDINFEDIKSQIDFEIIFFERTLTNELVITKILNQNKNLTVETLVFENG